MSILLLQASLHRLLDLSTLLDTGLLRASRSRIPSNIRIPLIFLRKMASYSCLGGSQCQSSSCKQACIGCLTFRPWYHITYSGFFVFPAKLSISRISLLYFIKESCPLSLGLNSLMSITFCTLAGLADITTT